MHCRFIIALAALCVLVLSSSVVRAGCDKDTDCKAERVCIDGECQSPPIKSCEKDMDCPGDQLCTKGVCGAPPGAAAAPAPQPAAVPPPPEPVAAPPPAPSVAPAAADTGSIQLSANSSGTVFVNGNESGRVVGQPLVIPNITPGLAEVTVVFDSGGSTTQKVHVQAGRIMPANIAQSRQEKYFAYREGFRFGVKGGGHWMYYDLIDVDGDELSGGGGLVALVSSYGVSPVVDLRTGFQASFTGYEVNRVGVFNALLTVPLILQLNLATVYSMRIGATIGTHIVNNTETGDTDAHFAIGPQASFATFRVGSRRQFEISAEGGTAFSFVDFGAAGTLPLALVYAGANFTALFLPKDPP